MQRWNFLPSFISLFESILFLALFHFWKNIKSLQWFHWLISVSLHLPVVVSVGVRFNRYHFLHKSSCSITIVGPFFVFIDTFSMNEIKFVIAINFHDALFSKVVIEWEKIRNSECFEFFTPTWTESKIFRFYIPFLPIDSSSFWKQRILLLIFLLPRTSVLLYWLLLSVWFNLMETVGLVWLSLLQSNISFSVHFASLIRLFIVAKDFF